MCERQQLSICPTTRTTLHERMAVNSTIATDMEVELRGNKFVATKFPDDAFLEFYMDGDDTIMDMVHTFVASSGRGKGLAEVLCNAAFSHCKQKELKARPSCSYIATRFLDKHPEYRDICVD